MTWRAAATSAVSDLAIRIRPSSEAPRPGDTLDLVCEVSGMDGARASWERVGAALPTGALSRGEVLRIGRLSESDGGLYRCTVRTASGAQYTDDYVLTIPGRLSAWALACAGTVLSL